MVTAVPSGPIPFQQYYAAHRAAVLRLLVGMVGPSDAEDCFQDTFLKALRAWPPPERGPRLDAWILTIARNTARDLLRRRGREQPVDGEQPAPADPRELVAAAPNELWVAVRALPPKQRAAVVLRIVLDQSHAQIAIVLDCSEAAARRSYTDGIAALRREHQS